MTPVEFLVALGYTRVQFGRHVDFSPLEPITIDYNQTVLEQAKRYTEEVGHARLRSLPFEFCVYKIDFSQPVDGHARLTIGVAGRLDMGEIVVPGTIPPKPDPVRNPGFVCTVCGAWRHSRDALDAHFAKSARCKANKHVGKVAPDDRVMPGEDTLAKVRERERTLEVTE